MSEQIIMEQRDWLKAVLEQAGCVVTSQGMGSDGAELGYAACGENYILHVKLDPTAPKVAPVPGETAANPV